MADGGWRAHEAYIAQVRAGVEQELARDAGKLGFWRRILLRRRIEREVRRRMRRLAPPDGLYLLSAPAEAEPLEER